MYIHVPFFSPFLVFRLLRVSVTVTIAVVCGGGKCVNYNLGENKWKTPPPAPPPKIKDAKVAGLCPSLGFIVDLVVGGEGVWGFEVPFYSVQDCRMYCVKL